MRRPQVREAHAEMVQLQEVECREEARLLLALHISIIYPACHAVSGTWKGERGEWTLLRGAYYAQLHEKRDKVRVAHLVIPHDRGS